MGKGFRAVLFDFDGTLTRPEAIDFAALRELLGCPPGTAILEFIEAIADPRERERAWRVLDDFELAAARVSVPNEGAEELVAALRDSGFGRAILSRNSRASILEALKSFRAVTAADFAAILSRENAGRPKPSPDGVLAAARLLGVTAAELLVVGDFVFDVAAGNAAGARTALLTNGRTRTGPHAVPAGGQDMDGTPDFTVATLRELGPILGL
jgi:hydrogenase expression/formation protein HypE